MDGVIKKIEREIQREIERVRERERVREGEVRCENGRQNIL